MELSEILKIAEENNNKEKKTNGSYQAIAQYPSVPLSEG